MDEFANVSDFNKAIKKLKAERSTLELSLYQRGISGRNDIIQRIDAMDQRINELTLKRNQKVRKAYTRPVIDPATSVVSSVNSRIDARHKPAVKNMNVQRDKATIKMTPVWFESNDIEAQLKGIVYPPNTVENHPFDTVARYRIAAGKSINFQQNPISLNETSIETLILMLDSFAQQFGAELSFTRSDLPFDKSAYRTACGIADLGSTHLLAANYISTAKFAINVRIDYDKSLVGSGDGMKQFLLNFSESMGRVLNTIEDYIRIFAIEKSKETRKQINVYLNSVFIIIN